MIQKTKTRKKRKIHKNSILHQKDGTCYLCMQEGIYRIWPYTEEHHIFDGPNRIHSEAEGLKVYLCISHHRGRKGVHSDINLMRQLQRIGQQAYEKTHSRQQFMQLFGRNYLED